MIYNSHTKQTFLAPEIARMRKCLEDHTGLDLAAFSDVGVVTNYTMHWRRGTWPDMQPPVAATEEEVARALEALNPPATARRYHVLAPALWGWTDVGDFDTPGDAQALAALIPGGRVTPRDERQ